MAEAAQRQRANGVLNALALPMCDFRPEADGKLDNADAAQPAGDVVPQLVNEDDEAEQENGNDDIQQIDQHERLRMIFSAMARACASTA